MWHSKHGSLTTKAIISPFMWTTPYMYLFKIAKEFFLSRFQLKSMFPISKHSIAVVDNKYLEAGIPNFICN